ncbi:hypothetical protein M427DRAFT_52178 [Gonapodya prolifera JEL478]|uniref:Uncharacterized protein n=1 Tax=Gonapodya prolifera (strain JEL478) TaxID=1344416 RepID=A0A139AV57_GONPJ|nr:hypothetical protein M427DRAFT_52178 [Gonapodya prolifera JEL478]|eukprot:KXS20584.1 hypothetical protein M427DRAFT_52178 [Gonapodya prolifera JEL478]
MQSLLPLPPPSLTADNPTPPRHSIAVPQSDSELLTSCELGDVQGVRRALAGDADVNCRKRVALGCRVFSEAKATKELFRRETREKGSGPSEIRVATSSCESALGLAVLADSLAIVQLLLEAGADPNLPVEWRIIRGRAVWTDETWREIVMKGWDLTFTFRNALELCLAEGVVTDYTGAPVTAAQVALNNFQIARNKPGALVKLDNPTQPQETFDQCDLIPNLNMVSLLLQYGVRPTKRSRAALLRFNNDPQLIQLLEEKHRIRSLQQTERAPRKSRD